MKPGLLTLNVLRVAHVFVQHTSTCVFTGYGLGRRLDMQATTVFMALRKLEARGWLKSELIEDPKRSRRLYNITPNGRESLTALLDGIQITTTLQQRSA